MEPQIIFDTWYEVETSYGTVVIPADIVGKYPTAGDFYDYLEGEYESHEKIKGYGARLSMPGYLDCTEWAVFPTYEEAQEYLTETWEVEF